VTASALILPVESQAREFDAKLLLACVAAERGFHVVLGSRNHIGYHAPRLPRGVYLGKGGRSQQRLFRILRRLGHEIALLDEEAVVRVDDEEIWSRRLAPAAIDLVTHLFAWGEDDAALLRRHVELAGRQVLVTGNPRADLTRPELRGYFASDVEALRERFSDFVLVNTNFAGINHLLPGMREERIAVERPETVAMAPFLRDFAAHRMRIFDGFVKTIPLLAKALHPRALVVRPHPAEDAATWRDAAQAADNVHVVQAGNIVPWLLAARLVVANNCTTLLEAHLVGTPGASFHPVSDARLDMALPRDVSLFAASPDDLAELARRALSGDLRLREDAAACLDRHVASRSGALASDRIVDALCNAGLSERKPAWPGVRSWVKGAFNGVKRAREKHEEAQGEEHAHSHALHELRFPAIRRAEVEQRVSRLARLTGRFAGLRVEDRWPHVFALSAR
jgi:surface carbohydrate biosynthesis protein